MASGATSVNRKVNNFFITSELKATEVSRDVWTCTRHCRLVNVREIHSVVGGSSAAIRPRKITDTSAPGASAGATVLEVAASIDLTATINTIINPALTATNSTLRFKPGDRLAQIGSGTLTGIVGVVTYEFEPV